MPTRTGTRQAAMCGIVAAYLFRPPTGLADGLALKELALPPFYRGDSPQLLVPPLRLRPLQGRSQIRRVRQASKPALSILPSVSDGKTFSHQFRRRASCPSVNFAAELVDAAPPDRLALVELARDGGRSQITFAPGPGRAAPPA